MTKGTLSLAMLLAASFFKISALDLAVFSVKGSRSEAK